MADRTLHLGLVTHLDELSIESFNLIFKFGATCKGGAASATGSWGLGDSAVFAFILSSKVIKVTAQFEDPFVPVSEFNGKSSVLMQH